MSLEHNNSMPYDNLIILSPKLRNALVLISALCDDQISPGQFAELESLVCNDDEVGLFYVQMMHLNASLHHFSSYFAPRLPANQELAALADDDGQSAMMDESMVLPAVLDRQAADGEDSHERFQPTSVLSDKPANDSKHIPYLKGGIAALVLLGVGILTYITHGPLWGSSHPLVSIAGVTAAPTQALTQAPTQSTTPASTPAPVPIATLNYTVRPVWDRPTPPPVDGKFFASDSLTLDSGDVQLSFHRGGHIVIEGPADLEFVSDTEIALHSGKIVATVPGGGLVIRCPNGSVTDLGTEFGVAVHPDGATEIAVFKGSVSAALKSAAASRPVKDLLLTVGQAAVMTQTALTVDEAGAIPQHYVRSLVNDRIKSLDVTDLVSGGDGTTRRRGIGISAITGEIGRLPPVQEIISDGKYHQVKGFPIIDGAFVPGGNKRNDKSGDKADIVDSAGDTFDFSTAANLGYNNIYTGGAIPSANASRFRTALGGVDYSTADHGLIFIHANGALTLDLDAVRRIYPDRSLTGFQCRVGNSCPPEMDMPFKGRDKTPVAAVQVLVNGIARYSNPHVTFAAGGFAVNIPIRKSDRFITLASTDAGKTNNHDWILWADAKLDLAAGN